jgi:rhomboid family GlyGly-CTERM serine protease
MGLDNDRVNQREWAAAGSIGLRLWAPPVLVCVLLLLAEAGGDPVREALRYAREPIAAGELWRLVSGHFVHLGWSHFLMNAVALLLIWALVGNRLAVRQWLLVFVLVIGGIDAGFWFIDRQLVWYVGLSGVLHGLLLAGLVAGWRASRGEAVLLTVLMAAKLLYEQLLGPLPGSEATAGGAVVVNAHLYGALAGLAAASLIRVKVGRTASI